MEKTLESKLLNTVVAELGEDKTDGKTSNKKGQKKIKTLESGW